MNIKILIVEHDSNDIELIGRELKKSGINYESEIVQNELDFRNALKNFVPDIILSDYSLPSFDGLTAFKIKEEINPDTPFILVSGTVGEENAVTFIKNGVTDYVLKDKLFGLTPKIKRALKEAEEKKEKTNIDQKLYKATHLYAFISQVNQNIVRVKDEITLFRNSCQMAIKFGKFKMAWIGLFDGENKKISLVEQCGMANEDFGLFANASYQNKGPQDYVLHTGKYFICNDILNDLELTNWKPFGLELCINSCIVLPIKKAGKIIGTFNLYSDELNFSEKEEIALLVEVTGDISFAIDLFEKEKRHKALEKEQIVSQKKIEESEKKYRQIVETSHEGIWVINKKNETIFVNKKFSEMFGYSFEEMIGKTNFDLMDEEGKVVIKEKLEHRKRGISEDFEHEFISKSGRKIWTRISASPIMSDSGNYMGVLAMLSDITERKKTELEILQKNEQLKSLTSHLQRVREEERTTISREIHDELGQQLTALKMNIDWIKHKQNNPDQIVVSRLEEMLQMSKELINTIRRISSDLRPAIIDDLGLIAALEWKCNDFEEKMGIPCLFISSVKERKFENDFGINTYRILQETLTNVSRHAAAKSVTVSVSENKTELLLEISDDGKGINNESVGKGKTLGIIGMKERAALLGGVLTIEGTKNKGTRTKLTLPLENEYINS